MKLKAADIYIDAKTPEQRLCRATICRALLDLLSCNEQATDAQKDDALRWLKSSDDSIGSFNYCCEQVDLDPEPMRDWVLRALKHGAVVTHGRGREYIQ